MKFLNIFCVSLSDIMIQNRNFIIFRPYWQKRSNIKVAYKGHIKEHSLRHFWSKHNGSFVFWYNLESNWICCPQLNWIRIWDEHPKRSTDRPQCRLQADHYRFVWFDWQHHCQEERSHPQNWHEILVSIHWWKIIDSSPPARFPWKNCSHTYGV